MSPLQFRRASIKSVLAQPETEKLIMSFDFERHPQVDELECYLMGHLPERRVEAIEEHLLVCEKCRVVCEDVEASIIALREGCAEWEREQATARERSRRRWQFGFPLPAFGLAAVAMVFMGLFLAQRGTQTDMPYSDVTLTATRDAGGEPANVFPAGHGLSMRLDTSSLTEKQFAVEVVDGDGNRVWSAIVPGTSPQLAVRVNHKFDAGRYWVRLNRTDGSALREYEVIAR